MRILVTLLAFFALVAATPVSAQTATPDGATARRLELAERYLELGQGSNMTKTMRRLYEEAFMKKEMPAEERAWWTENLIVVMDDIIQATVRDLRDDVAELFTEAELEASIAFMSSPLGRSVTDKSVELGFVMQQAMGPHMITGFEKLGEKYCARFECEADEGRLAKD